MARTKNERVERIVAAENRIQYSTDIKNELEAPEKTRELTTVEKRKLARALKRIRENKAEADRLRAELQNPPFLRKGRRPKKKPAGGI